MTHAATGPDGIIRSLAAALTTTDDRKLVALVPLIEALPARALVEELLETVRPRLWLLRPPRRLSLHRVLAVPLESLLSDPLLCDPGGIRMPRTLLPALFALVEPRLDPALRTSLEDACRGLSSAETQEVQRLGRRLWPAATLALHQAFIDPRATNRALADQGVDPGPLNDHHAMVLALMKNAEAIAAAMLPQDGRMPDPGNAAAPHRDLLLQAAAEDMVAWRGIAAGFLLRAPSPDVVVRLVAQARLSLRQPALMQVIEEVVASLSRELGLLPGALPPGAALPAASFADRRSEAGVRLSLILSELSGQGSRLDSLATEAGQALVRQFAGTLDGAVLAPLQRMQAEGRASTETIGAVEAAARAARRMEVAGRAMGRAGMFGPALATVRGRILELARRAPALADPAGAIALPDLVRLMEILAGPDEALAMIEQLAAEA